MSDGELKSLNAGEGIALISSINNVIDISAAELSDRIDNTILNTSQSINSLIP